MTKDHTHVVIIDRSPWWEEAVAGRIAPIRDGEPQSGYFARRLVRGGVLVPCRIWIVETRCVETGELMADVELHCEVNGAMADPYQQWTYLCSHPIAEADFRYRMAVGEWATAHAPDAPEADPSKPVSLADMPMPF